MAQSAAQTLYIKDDFSVLLRRVVMEVGSNSETSINFYQATRKIVPKEDSRFHTGLSVNLSLTLHGTMEALGRMRKEAVIANFYDYLGICL
jgi:hypothetical protein